MGAEFELSPSLGIAVTMVRVLLAVVLVCAACGRAQSPPPAAGEETQVVTLINDRRGAVPCPAVAPDDRLAAAARRHADDMLQHDVRDHTGSDGSTAERRITQAGFPASRTGEILYWAQGAGDANEAVVAWMDSAGHRAIIQECAFTHVGVAILRFGGKFVAVADFAAS